MHNRLQRSQQLLFSLFLLIMASLPVFSFSMSNTPPPPPAGLELGLNTDIDLDGRSFDVYVPSGLTGSAPLVIDLHGFTSSKTSQRTLSGFYQLADIEGFIVAWPQGNSNSWNAGPCCGTANIRNYDDTGFLVSMVNWIAAQDIAGQLTVDANKVYATGLSNGGAMSHRLGLEAADLFAAIAPVAFHLDYSHAKLRNLLPSRPMPVLEIHGNDDTVISYPCSSRYGCVEDGFEDWAAINSCTGSPVETWNNGSGAFRRVYENCSAGVTVEWMVLNAPHVAYDNSDGVDVAAQAWEFLSRHSLN